MKREPRVPLSSWQAQVATTLRMIASHRGSELQIPGGLRVLEGGQLEFCLRVRTSGIVRHPGGLHLRPQEDFVVTVPRHPFVPPQIHVRHLRFLRFAHVLQGTRLCLYLDPSREWDPDGGFGPFVQRLMDWLEDASAARFDPSTALYHAVGGTDHTGSDAATLVVRDELPSERVHRGWIVMRAAHRYDLQLARPAAGTLSTPIPILTLDTDLPLGAGTDLTQLCAVVDDPYIGYRGPDAPFRARAMNSGLSLVLLRTLAACAVRHPKGQRQMFLIAVPHPAGGPPHLIAGSLSAGTADRIRVRMSIRPPATEEAAVFDDGAAIEWLRVSDERKAVTTRRDSDRPTNGFIGKNVHIWGCGGIGSWVAEYVVRAGAASVTLVDPGVITGGHLVRQNFVEADVGAQKAIALANRLRGIRDQVQIHSVDAALPADELNGVDVVIDASVSVFIGRYLNAIAATPNHPYIAQMATDTRTGTLGVMSVSASDLPVGPFDVDLAAGAKVKASGALEAFADLWGDPGDRDEIIPTRGCSTPTFHGSAADLASVAASLTSILGAHLAGPSMSGTHLVSLPHGEAGPRRHFIPHTIDGTDDSALWSGSQSLTTKTST